MSETKRIESDDQQNAIGQSSNKRSIRFLGEQGLSDDQIPSGNFMKSVNTSRAVSDSTREDDEDIEDMVSENQSKFRQIKSIDIILPPGEEKLVEIISPSKRLEKSCNASSVHSENQDDNLSVHFGGLEFIDDDENEIPKFEYEPDDVPIRSILKNDLNRSRNISFDVRMLKDIEGKMISHDNLSMNPDNDHEDGDESRNTILKDSQLYEDSISQSRSQGSGIMNKSIDSSNEDEDDFYDDDNQGEHKIEYRNRLDSEVRFKLQPLISETEKPIDINAGKRNSLQFPAYSILKNSPLVQPSEFKALKQIEKVSHHSHHNSTENSVSKNIPLNSHNESDEDSGDSRENEESDVRFVGDIVLQENNAYKFKYNPEENPKRPIIKRGSCIAHYAMTPTAGSTQLSCFTPLSNFKQELAKKKRMSYDFLSLKNVDGKVIKHWQQKFLEDNTNNDDQKRDIKFGGIEFLDTYKLGDQTQISKAIKPQKPILKINRGRSNSCDFKKSIKNIDGVYIRKEKKEVELVQNNEEEKVVHFGEVVQTEESLSNIKNTGISINLNLVRMYNSQQDQEVSQGEELSQQKSILKRSSSVQMRKPPVFITSNDNTPTTIKKSTFSNRKIEIKETINSEAPTQDTFTANWTSLRNDYLESAFKFLIRIDTKQLCSIFQHGMENQMFNQIIDVLHSRVENDAFVKSYIENIYKIKNFRTLLFTNRYQQENIQEILDQLEMNQAINQSTYKQLCSHYILKSAD